jgi:hypothetical protein
MYQYHYLYKITNLINNKIYIGVHSTDKLDDGYFGSGSAIIYSLKKHGKENFKKEILEWFDWRCEALNREAEIVNFEFVKQRDTYNLQTGGFNPILVSNESKLKMRNAKLGTHSWLYGKKGMGFVKSWNKGLKLKPLSVEHKQKISIKGLGIKRSETFKQKLKAADKSHLFVGCEIDNIKFQSIKEANVYAKFKYNMDPHHVIIAMNDESNNKFKRLRNFKSSQCVKVSIDGIIFDSKRLAEVYVKGKYGIGRLQMENRLTSNKFENWVTIGE